MALRSSTRAVSYRPERGPRRRLSLATCLRCGRLTANLKRECRRCLDKALEYVRFGRSK